MDKIAKFEILEELRLLKARYFYHLDKKDWAGWREVFADDVILDVSGQFPDAPDPSIYMIRGADAVVQTVAAQLGDTVTSHHGHTPMIDVKNEDEASGIWALEDNLFMSDGSHMAGFGHYTEEYRRIDGKWRIWRTKLTRLHVAFTPGATKAG